MTKPGHVSNIVYCSSRRRRSPRPPPRRRRCGLFTQVRTVLWTSRRRWRLGCFFACNRRRASEQTEQVGRCDCRTPDGPMYLLPRSRRARRCVISPTRRLVRVGLSSIIHIEKSTRCITDSRKKVACLLLLCTSSPKHPRRSRPPVHTRRGHCIMLRSQQLAES